MPFQSCRAIALVQVVAKWYSLVVFVLLRNAEEPKGKGAERSEW